VEFLMLRGQFAAPKEKYRVLVVDDDPVGLETIEAALADDVEVVTTKSPEAALKLIEASTFHVICSDYQMVGMNGLDLLQRATARSPHLGCVLITGSNEYLRATQGDGRYYVLVKPIDPGRLIALVKQLARVADMKRGSEHPRSGVRQR
jgi:DNA-binding NtrC family response regulator